MAFRRWRNRIEVRRTSASRGLVAAAVTCMFSVVACSGGTPAPSTAPPSPAPTAAPCASALPDLVTYTPPAETYTVAVPRGWVRIASPDGITFSHQLESLRLEQVPYGSPSTTASFRSNELPGLRQASRGFRLRRIDTVALRAGPAVLAEYVETIVPNHPGGVAVERDVRRYELWHADQRVVLTMASPCEAAAAPLWRRITDSFRWRR